MSVKWLRSKWHLTLGIRHENPSIAQDPDRMPPEILAEIFLSCLPHKPIDHEQPNVNISPMNLCRICSYWRNVALGTPGLWNSLYHICYASADVEDKDILRYGIRPIDIEFLRWWAANIGPHPPTLRLKIDSCETVAGLQRSERVAAESNHIFVLDLLASAQCLAFGDPFRKIFRANTHQLISPNLQSLLILDDDPKWPCLSLTDLLTNHCIPGQVYQRLYIEELYITDANFGAELPWTSLTHVCIDVNTELSTWIHFLKKLCNLEYGNFRLDLTNDDPPFSPDITLPRLRQLFINCMYGFNSQLFQTLTFPALTGFRLYQSIFSIYELYGLLRATPALTELHCGVPFDRNLRRFFPFPLGVDPLSTIIPNLEFLVIQISQLEFLRSRGWRESLINSAWLNLRSENNRIQTVLFYVNIDRVDQRAMDITEAHLAELRIDGVELRIHWGDTGTASIFDHKFYQTKDFMDWDEDMGFYMEHTIHVQQ